MAALHKALITLLLINHGMSHPTGNLMKALVSPVASVAAVAHASVPVAHVQSVTKVVPVAHVQSVTKVVPAVQHVSKVVPVAQPVARVVPVVQPVTNVVPVVQPVAKIVPVVQPVAKIVPVPHVVPVPQPVAKLVPMPPMAPIAPLTGMSHINARPLIPVRPIVAARAFPLAGLSGFARLNAAHAVNQLARNSGVGMGFGLGHVSTTHMAHQTGYPAIGHATSSQQMTHVTGNHFGLPSIGAAMHHTSNRLSNGVGMVYPVAAPMLMPIGARYGQYGSYNRLGFGGHGEYHVTPGFTKLTHTQTVPNAHGMLAQMTSYKK